MLAAGTIQKALDDAIVHLGADSGTIHVKAPERMVLLLTASRNIPPPVLDVVREVPWGKGMAGMAVERLQPVNACNLQTNLPEGVPGGARNTGMQGALVVPMLRAGKAVGAFGVGCVGERDFNDEETAWLLDYAGRLAEQLDD